MTKAEGKMQSEAKVSAGNALARMAKLKEQQITEMLEMNTERNRPLRNGLK